MILLEVGALGNAIHTTIGAEEAELRLPLRSQLAESILREFVVSGYPRRLLNTRRLLRTIVNIKSKVKLLMSGAPPHLPSYLGHPRPLGGEGVRQPTDG